MTRPALKRGPRARPLELAAFLGALVAAAGCSFPIVSYEEPCSGGAACAVETDKCATFARQQRTVCEQKCKEDAACRSGCATAETQDLSQCVIACEGCALTQGCHNSEEACTMQAGISP